MLSIRRAFTIWEFIVVVVIIAILAAILFPVFSRSSGHQGSKHSACRSNLKQISLGFAQYVQDYDEKFPPVTADKELGWANIIDPYVKSWQLFRCPKIESEQAQTIDYFYNARLARFEAKNIESPSFTILLGEGTPNAPSNASLSALPSEWLTATSSPVKRHLDGANYAFADGHVKWLKPEKITLDSPRKSSNPTFLPR